MTTRDYGQVDGEIPDLVTVRFSGEALIDRALLRGERTAFTVIGTVQSVAFKEKSGALLRTHSVGVETAAEPTEQLGEDVTRFLLDIEDAREGRQQLPLDEGEDDEV